MMEEPEQRIQLWSSGRRRLTRPGGLRLRWTLSGHDLEVTLPATAVDGRRASEITLWEVDWNAEGVFISRSRGIRSWRSGELPSRLSHRYRRSGTYRVQVRAWDSLGRVLTHDGPRTDVTDVTTYTYFSATATCPGVPLNSPEWIIAPYSAWNNASR